MSRSEVFKKDEVKRVPKIMSDFNYNSNHTFYRFYKEYDEFEGISTESNYDKMKDFNKLLIKFKSLKTRKTETQFEKERMLTKNVD